MLTQINVAFIIGLAFGYLMAAFVVAIFFWTRRKMHKDIREQLVQAEEIILEANNSMSTYQWVSVLIKRYNSKYHRCCHCKRFTGYCQPCGRVNGG